MNDAPLLSGGLPFLGQLLALRHDPLSVFERAGKHPSEVVRLEVGPRSMFLVRKPEHVRYVLQENSGRFSKQTRGYEALRHVLGNGLVTSEGSFWLRQRRLAQPAFHRQRIAQFAETMVRLTGEAMERWRVAAERGEVIDVSREMMALTLRVVGWTLLSAEVGPDSPLVSLALDEVLHQVRPRTTALLRWPLSIPTPKNLALARAKRQLDDVVLRVIDDRRKSGETGDDLLGMLMAARDEETGEAMSDEQLRDEVMTIFLAGHETTANALTWALYLLSQHPDMRERLTREVREVMGDRPPSFADLPRLQYPLAVVSEALRLYPPVWLLMRRAEEDGEVGGFRIPRGAFVAISPFVCHRDAGNFPDPERFDPERFMGEAANSVPRFAYLPFSGGPRICIGNSFALMEAQLVLAMIAQRFRLDLVPGHRADTDPAVTLRPKYGMRMTVNLREAPSRS
jgi:cytochrome P450